jgi:hypothetical protein
LAKTVRPVLEIKRMNLNLQKIFGLEILIILRLLFFFLQKKANGTAVIICSDRAYEFSYNAEGVDAAKYFTNLGVTAFVLKYCLYSCGGAEPVTLPIPPAFMLAASDNSCCSEPIVKLLAIYRQQKASAEVHLYAQGSHVLIWVTAHRLLRLNRGRKDLQIGLQIITG